MRNERRERLKDLARPIKRRVLWATGKDLVFSRDVRLPVEVHGNRYGGFGLLKDSLDAESVVLSFGIGEDASFDASVIERYGCTVHAFDPTPRAVAWAQENMACDEFVLYQVAAASENGTLRLYLPANPAYVSASLQAGGHTASEYFNAEAKTLTTIVNELGVDRIDVLKMDIEGAEYGVLKEYFAGSNPLLPRQLALEFHHFWPEIGFEPTRRAMSSLRALGYQIAWISRTHHELLLVRQE